MVVVVIRETRLSHTKKDAGVVSTKQQQQRKKMMMIAVGHSRGHWEPNRVRVVVVLWPTVWWPR